MKKALIRNTDGFVENVIEIEEDSTWQTPDGHVLIDAGDGSRGDTWDGTKFVKPEPVISEPERDLAAEIDEIKAEIVKLKAGAK